MRGKVSSETTQCDSNLALRSFHEVGLSASSGWLGIYNDWFPIGSTLKLSAVLMNRRTEGFIPYCPHRPVQHHPPECQRTDVSKVTSDKQTPVVKASFPLLEWALEEGRANTQYPGLRRSLTMVRPKWMNLEFPPNKTFLASHHTCSSHFYYLRAPGSEPPSAILTWRSAYFHLFSKGKPLPSLLRKLCVKKLRNKVIGRLVQALFTCRWHSPRTAGRGRQSYTVSSRTTGMRDTISKEQKQKCVYLFIARVCLITPS